MANSARFLKHQGVVLRHVYQDGDYEHQFPPLEYWYEVDETGEQFDIRELPDYHAGVDHREFLRQSIEKGYLTDGPPEEQTQDDESFPPLTSLEEVVDVMLESARLHGDESGNETEIGDLQQLVSLLWTKLSPTAKRQVAREISEDESYLDSAEAREAIARFVRGPAAASPPDLSQDELRLLRTLEAPLFLPEIQAFLAPFGGSAEIVGDDLDGSFVVGGVPMEQARAAAAALEAAGYELCCETDMEDGTDRWAFDVWPNHNYPEVDAALASYRAAKQQENFDG